MGLGKTEATCSQLSLSPLKIQKSLVCFLFPKQKDGLLSYHLHSCIQKVISYYSIHLTNCRGLDQVEDQRDEFIFTQGNKQGSK